MKIIVHSAVGDSAIQGSLGADDYSYYFVRRAFTDALEPFAAVVVVADPATEVDPIFEQATMAGEACLFLSFAPPHKTVLGLRCPVIPVFAWEFGTIPNEAWDEDVRNDWRVVFGACRGAIALSSYTVRVVREAIGDLLPVAAIPAPVFERYVQEQRRAPDDVVVLRIDGSVLDTDRIAAYRRAPAWPPEPVPLLTPGPVPAFVPPVPILEPSAGEESCVPEDASPGLIPPMPEPRRIGLRRRLQITRYFALEWYRLAVRDLLPRPLRSANALVGRSVHRVYRRGAGRAMAPVVPDAVTVLAVEAAAPMLPVPDLPPVPIVVAAPVPPETVALSGVVFVSMFSPRDGRKNWFDIVTAFCWAFRDTPDAVLVLKIVANDRAYEPTLLHLLKELSPFRCRVVVLHGYLDTAEYRALIAAASFYVNASHCEGLCLPVCEFMSAGTPAIAPDHTAFEDYVSPENALVIGSGIEHNVWPGDTRDLFRTTRYRIDWHALMLAYRDGYRIAREEPERYRRMSDAARDSMRAFCSTGAVGQALHAFLGTSCATSRLEPAA